MSYASVMTAASLGVEVLTKIAKTDGIPGLKPGVTLYAHQREAIDKLNQRNGSLLFSHPVGSGKTLTSIAAFESLRAQKKATRALVVVPASLRNNYLENGVKKFTNATGAIFGNSQEIDAGTHVSLDTPDKDARYHIVSYDMYRKNPQQYITAAGADTVIYDEIHKAKNEGVKVTEAIKAARPFHKNFIGLTGSIVSNTPADIVPLVDAMTNGSHVLGSKTTFESRFIQTNDKGEKTVRNQAVLRALLQPYVHHVDPLSLGQNAPKKIVEEVRVEMSPFQSQLYRYVTNQLDPLTKLKLKAGVSNLNNAALSNIFSKLIKLRQVSNSIQTMDASVSLADSAESTPKIKRILDDVQEHLRETPDGQAVVHTNLIQGGVDVLTAGLKARGIEHALFIGKGNAGVTEATRQSGVQDYRDGKKRVIVLSAAGGEGLDLPNTTFMAMTDGHFNPEKINQAEARGIRAGGQAHRNPDKRQVVVKRYVSVLPNDAGRLSEIGMGIWENINPQRILARVNAGGPALYNPFKKTPATDQWIYDVANAKGGLNAAVHGVLKTAELYQTPTTHEEFEELLEKRGFNLEKLQDYAVKGLTVGHQAVKNPAVGAILGAGYGALLGGIAPRTARERDQDPNAERRNRVSSVIGGALGGAAGSKLLASGAPLSALSVAASSSSLGKSIGNIFAPKAGAPTSVTGVLGKSRTLSDKAIFEKYWERFGPELETKGIHAELPPEEEMKYVSALKDLYTETTAKSNPISVLGHIARSSGKPGKGPSKAALLSTTAYGMLIPLVYGGMFGAARAGGSANRADIKRSALHGMLGAAPVSAAVLASGIKGYRELFVDPSVSSTASKSDARFRRDLSPEQIRNLLRGLPVEQIKKKQHNLG